MTRILLTGASGFIAAHILEILLKNGHKVRFTVRTEEKAQALLSAYPEYASNVDYVLVPDIAVPGAFDEAVKSDPPFEAIIHTASPFHFRVTDIQKQLLEPAIIGTTSVLKAAKAYAPTVKRVVITSSFAAIVDRAIGNDPSKTYSEADWNPITEEQAQENASEGYRASKTFAEKAAWKFVEEEKPNFDVATINPPLVYGPIKKETSTLKQINTSNERILDLIQGKYKDGIAQTAVFLWVDVRNVAQAHVEAAVRPDAGGKRFFLVAGKFSNQEVVDIIAKHYPEYKDVLPKERQENDGFPKDGVYSADNSRSRQVLGIEYISLEDSIKDTVASLKVLGA
ncbi:NAD(P)-binding protein [Ascobolus immersus RN42]|uniref:NAD(P)-binding protein n=1 Tax=Ascobolus immersus RN42 TaxID=1160509 RepID=A0A3N4I9F2_ASCIM|nr:NAD(P)-binding protein [Ascobolus immersus RN42]